MFLSRLLPNLRNQRARMELARPYEMHRTLWSAFPDGEPGRVLFRVDTVRHNGIPVVIVQSEFAPDWTRLPPGYLSRAAESKPFELAVATGQKLRFCLRANPTKRIASKNTRHVDVMVGKRIGLATEAEQIAWLLRKGEAGGFRIPGEWVNAKHPETSDPIRLPNFRVDAIPEGLEYNSKPKCEGVFIAIRFEGVLEVTEPSTFRDTVFAGIGSAKGFGFGLLSVGPV